MVMVKISLPLNIKGSIALLGASLTIALFGTLVHVLRTMFGPVTQTVFRALLAALIMAGCMLVMRHKPMKLSRVDTVKTVLVGFCGSLTLGLFTIVALHDKAASATFLIFAGAILTSLIGGMVFLGERATIVRIVALTLVVGGLFLYANGFTYKGALTFAGLLGGVSDGVANIIRKQMRHLDRPTVVTYQYGVGAVAAALYVLFSHEQPILQVHILPILVMITFAVLALALGTFLLYGYAHVDLQTGAILSAMQIFFAIILGATFLHQMPTGNEIMGCFLISTASCLTVLDMRKVALRVKRLLGWRTRSEEIEI